MIEVLSQNRNLNDHLASEKMVKDDYFLGSSDTLHESCHLVEVDSLELGLVEEVLPGHPGWRVKQLETVLVKAQVMSSSIPDSDRDNTGVQLLGADGLVLVLFMLMSFSGEHKWLLSSLETIISNLRLYVLSRGHCKR